MPVFRPLERHQKGVEVDINIKYQKTQSRNNDETENKQRPFQFLLAQLRSVILALYFCYHKGLLPLTLFRHNDRTGAGKQGRQGERSADNGAAAAAFLR